MCRAGTGAWRIFQHAWPQCKSPAILCGSGNNGGDGYVFALRALQEGLNPVAISVGDPNTPDACRAFRDFIESGGRCVKFNGDLPVPSSDSVVDALFGIGISRPPGGVWRNAIDAIRDSGLPVLSLDVPSGLNADTGNEFDIAVKANMTVTFIARKIGLYTGRAPEFCGSIAFESLDVPEEAFDGIAAVGALTSKREIAKTIPRRPSFAHKGMAGRVAIIGGSPTMEGAALMSAQASFRAGSGLVSVITQAAQIAASSEFPEVRIFSVTDPSKVCDMVADADAIGIGPGLGTGQWAQNVWNDLSRRESALIVDADALNLLAQSRKSKPGWVLTPHPGEAARLLGTTPAQVQSDRSAAAREISKQYGGICVLKGAGTLIADSDRLWICDRGNPGMAAGGMGDLLTGVISALRAQGLPAAEAARAGVWIHANSGDDCAEQNGMIGMMATDLLPYIRSNINRLANEF